MQKSGPKVITAKQYRATDTFIFALILAISEVLAFFAGKWFPAGALFTFSLMVPIVLTVMMRWGWIGAPYATANGILWCLLSLSGGKIGAWQWCVYIIGNSFIAFMLIPILLIGKEKIKRRWWACALLAAGGWLCVYLGRSVVWAIAFTVSPIEGTAVWTGFTAFAAGDSLSLPVAIIILLVLRRFDGMLEDQITYLKRLTGERMEKMRYNGEDGPLEIDEDALSILKRDDDLY